MPFGKHKGKDLADIPPDYLSWCVNTIEDLHPPLRAAILARLGVDDASSPVPPSPDLRRVAHAVRDAIRESYRIASRKFHPDHRDGNTDAMIGINALYERLNEVVPRRIRELPR